MDLIIQFLTLGMLVMAGALACLPFQILWQEHQARKRYRADMARHSESFAKLQRQFHGHPSNQRKHPTP